SGCRGWWAGVLEARVEVFRARVLRAGVVVAAGGRPFGRGGEGAGTGGGTGRSARERDLVASERRQRLSLTSGARVLRLLSIEPSPDLGAVLRAAHTANHVEHE